MSFSFQQPPQIKIKDEEETPPAREVDPLLPAGARGGGGRTQDPSSSLFDNSLYNSTATATNRLRSRRTSRSPSTTADDSSRDTKQQPTNPTKLLIDSQMNHADDDTSTTSSAILDAAAAAAAAHGSNQHFHNHYDAHHNDDNSYEGYFRAADQDIHPHRSLPSDEHSQVSHNLNSSSPLPHPASGFQPQQHHNHTNNNHLSHPQHNPQQHRIHQNHNGPPTHYEPHNTHSYHIPPSPEHTQSHDARSMESGSQGQQPPLLEIPEEIYAVRKSALKVLKPLTKTWIVISVGFSLTVLFGAARWTLLLPTVPYWFILLPCWSSHVGLLWLHVLSARALSRFIAEANDSRQRPDSRDHLNRTEYLPLLQRSLKFGLKTGILSFFVFIFEILIFIRLERGTITLTAAFVPLWLLVAGGIFDGLVCKTQHFLRVLCWILSFAAMILLVLKMDHGMDQIRWRIIVCPVVAVLSIASGSLIYIVYGHQIGYYRLTEAQLTAGNLYALAALICIILVVMIGEVIPMARPVEVETKLFLTVLAPLVICLTGMGAWVVSRDEFSRLLLYGGQAAVHPKRLRWVPQDGWTCVQAQGVTLIPMFGEVSFQPLERKSVSPSALELCACCSGKGCCYPYEEDEEEAVAPSSYHPYLDSTLPGARGSRASNSYNTLRGL